MGSFFQFLVRLLVIGGLSMVFILALIFLRPSRVHRRRKISTSILKITYLAYLAVYLLFVYIISFTEKDLQEYFHEKNYILAVLAGLIPTIGMLLRRRVKKVRSPYNYLLSGLHALIIILLLRFFFQVLVVL